MLALLAGVLTLPFAALGQSSKTGEGGVTAPAPAPTADEIRQKKEALAAERRAAQAAVESASADGREAPAPLARAASILQQIDLALDQQFIALGRAAEREELKAEAEGRIAALGAGDVGDERPFSFALLERLRDELERKSTQSRTAAETQQTAEASLEAAREADEQRQRELRQAREALEVNRATERVAGLTAALRRAELEGRLAGAQRALCKLELANATSGVEIDTLERSYLEQKLAVVARETRFTRDDLQERIDEIERLEFELNQAIEAARRELEWIAGRWVEARQALDRAPGDAALAEALEARRIARIARQEEAALLGEQLDRAPGRKDTWNRRFLVSTGNRSREELPVWAEEAEGAIEQLRRQERLRSQRRDDLRDDLALLDEEIQDAGEQGADVRRWLDEQRREFKRLMESYDADLAGVRGHRRLEEKLLAEIKAVTGSESVGDRFSKIGEWLLGLWRFEITQIDDRPITVSKIVLGIALLFIGIWISRVISRIVGRRVLERMGVNEDARLVARTLMFWGLATLFTLLALQLLHVPLTVFTLLGGALAIGLGFGAQTLISNFISGWILITERPVRIGDLVEVDDILGNIERVGARCTSIRRTDGIHMLVPNSLMLERTVINWTHADRSVRTRLRVGVVYGSPTHEVEALIRTICTQCERVLSNPAPIIIFEDFGDNALIFDVYFWVHVQAEMDIRRAESEIRFAIDHAFRAAGIVIAFPQRDVHLDAPKPIEVRMVENVAPAPDEASRARERRAMLARVEIFESLNSDELGALAAAVTEEAFEARTDIIRQGDTGSSLYVVTSGLVQVTVRTGEHVREVGQLVPGDFFGEMAMLTGDPYSGTVTAVTDVAAYVVSSEMLQPILRKRPEVAYMLGDIAERRRAKLAGPGRAAQSRAGAGELRRRILGFFGMRE